MNPNPIKTYCKENSTLLFSIIIPFFSLGGYLWHQNKINQKQEKHIENINKIRQEELNDLKQIHRQEIKNCERQIMELNIKLQLLTSDNTNLFHEQMNNRNHNNIRYKSPNDLLNNKELSVIET
mgnify:FL=1|jgi:hypothetical protein|tara:strand:- start:22058 stop:22429 length:372 start_codon:yes stop_codon:yes gene_type:complete